MLISAFMSLLLPGSGEAAAGRWGYAAVALIGALSAWTSGIVIAVVLAHVGSAWVAGCVGEKRAAG